MSKRMPKKGRVSSGAATGRRRFEVKFLENAETDARKILNDGQWLYVSGVIRRLEEFGNRMATSDLRLEKMTDDLWELKLKGNTLGRLNVRVFFSPLADDREVVVLGVIKKEQDGKTPPHILTRMQNRRLVYCRKRAQP